MTKDLAFKTAFNVTAWFETSGQPYTLATGNFDNQGLSWGPRQTCIGQGSLQPLLERMIKEQPVLVKSILGPYLFASLTEMLDQLDVKSQTAYVVAKWNDDHGSLAPAWKTALAELGRETVIQNIFMDDARGSIPAVDTLAAWISEDGVVTVRIWCLAYDFVTQNGGFNSLFKAAISTFLLALKPFQKDYKDRMRAICWLRAGWTYIRGQQQFADDVLGRKLTIVEGRRKFRGQDVDLGQLYNVSDEAVV